MSEINDIEEQYEGNFPKNPKWIQKYQRLEPRIIDKFKNGTYHNSSFRGGINTYLNLITYKDTIVIPSKFQSYVFNWYHRYLRHTGMDITEAIICQYLYWTDIRDSIWKEITNCDTCQRTKQSNKSTVH